MSMNPLFKALTGISTPLQNAGGQSAPPMMNGPFGAFNGVLQRAQQMASTLRNPQQLVQQYFPDAPAEIQNDPEQLIGWLQQTGRVNPQMVQMARQMMGR